MLKISELYIYPIKSLGGIPVKTAIITDRGFQYDRRWMLIDSTNRFISQREVPEMALLKLTLSDTGLKVAHKNTNSSIIIPFKSPTNEFSTVTVWDEPCIGQFVSYEANKWFTDILKIKCRLVYMPDVSERQANPNNTNAKSLTSFSDAYPFMMIGQASLDDLNSRLKQPILINRFRPNIVFAGGKPFEEDLMDTITINNIIFNGIKLCGRCNIITIDQDNLARSKEPLKTLATYRSKKEKHIFWTIPGM